MKSGYQIAYSAEALVIHSHNYTNRQQFTRNFDLAVSQAMHPEVFKGIRSESEGIRLVKQTASYLKSIGRSEQIPRLILSSGFKYLGYRLGKMYWLLPRFLVKAFSMNKGFWDSVNWEEE